MLTFFYAPGTCALAARIVLEEIGAPYDLARVDFSKQEQTSPDYLAINPKGVVPTLVHDGQAITESSIIIEYVDDAFPGAPLTPEDPVCRAKMRHWLRFSDDVAYKAVYAPTWQYMRHRAAKGTAMPVALVEARSRT